MDQQYLIVAKIPMLDTCKFEQWQFRMQQYLQHEHYALWEVIEFGDSYKAPENNPSTTTTSTTTTSTTSGDKSGRTVTLTTEDMQKKKNDVKSRTTLLLSLPDEHQLRFSKHKTAKELWAATKRTKKNLLKQQYGKFRAEGAEMLEQTFTRLQVKIEHQRASGLLQQLDIPIWKWDEISMDFVTGLPQTQRRHDAIWVVVDRLTKSAHFLPIRKDYSVSRLAEIFQQEIVRLHGTPSAIVSDRDPRFAYRFWKEFAYNNSWHASIKCAPFGMLYGRKCRAPICWDQVGERVIKGPEMIEVTNAKVAVAKEKLKEARTRQKSYADKHRRSLEFQPGDHVFLKVSPARGVRRFGIKGKLSP
nr:retrotransposable element Tf2 [Tanacetum cinerariifolium]